MKAVILAGGFGTRISEESHLKPKPMIEIGEKPILWHIMKEFSYYGVNEFIICAGYKQHLEKLKRDTGFMPKIEFKKGIETMLKNRGSLEE